QTAVERDTRKRKRQGDGFSTAQGFDFPSPAKADQQRGERLQGTFQIRTSGTSAFGNKAHATGLFREDVQHQAGFAPGTTMQDKGALPSIHMLVVLGY